jgi:hypothetical protein
MEYPNITVFAAFEDDSVGHSARRALGSNPKLTKTG